MDDLIRRKDAMASVEAQCVDGKMWGNEEGGMTLIDAYEAIDEIDSIPAVDAVEVVHGEWQIEFGKSFMSCSECSFCVVRLAEFNYCPNCGARMDGRREEEHNEAN